MKTAKYISGFLLLTAFGCISPVIADAQRGTVKRQVKKDMEKKYADPQREKGKAELEKITYENDKRYADPTNKVQATIAFEDKELNKKGEAKTTVVQKIVFGKTGECIVMNEGDKKETWMIYNYADKANYIVDVKKKTAIKMPLINMHKMTESGAKKNADKNDTISSNGWKATGEEQNINGYNCKKYIYTYPDNKSYSSMDMWMSDEVKLNLGDNYMFGARLNAYKIPANPQYKEMAHGFIVRSVLYDKKGVAVSQRDLKEFKKSADEQYFDMSKFKVTDVMGVL